MSKANEKIHAIMEKKTSVQESRKLNQIFFHKQHLKRVYPFGLQKSSSSSSSSSLSQISNDSSMTLADHENLISPSQRRERVLINTSQPQKFPHAAELGELKRCNWITNNCGKYIHFQKKLFHFIFFCIKIMVLN